MLRTFALLVLLLSLGAGLAQAAPRAQLNRGSQVNAGTCDQSGSPVVNVVQKVKNDVDSGFGGYWATDEYSRTIKLWPRPAPSARSSSITARSRRFRASRRPRTPGCSTATRCNPHGSPASAGTSRPAGARSGLVARLEPVGVPVHEPPLPRLQPEDVRHPVRPLDRRVRPGDARPDPLDVRRHDQARGGHRREILVGDRASALELPGRPVPPPADRAPAALVAAPAEERGDVVLVGVERLDRARIAGHQGGHRGPEPLERRVPAG